MLLSNVENEPTMNDPDHDDDNDKHDDEDFWKKFWRFLRTLGSTGVEAAKSIAEMAKWYVGFLVKLFVAFLIASAALLLLLLLPTWLWKPEAIGQVFSIWLIFLGVLAFIFMLFASPLLVAARIAFKVVPAAEDITIWVARVMAAVWFWILMLAIYFYVVPVGDNPKAIPIVLMTTAALALGAFTGWVNFNAERVRRFLTGKLIVLFVIATISFAFPQLIRGVTGLAARLGGLGARAVDSVNDPKPKEFQSLEEVRAFPFFSGGKPQLYYDGDLSSEFQLFDSMGRSPFRANSPFTGRELKPVKSEKERQQVIASYERHFEKLATETRERELQQQREEQSKREQTRLEEERRQREIREASERQERERLARQEAQTRAAEAARVAQEQAKARAEAQLQQFQQQQSDKIAKGIVPPLSVIANKLPDSWRLYFENTSETVTVNITRLRKSINGVEETTPFTKTMRPGEREYMAYQADFHQGDMLDVFCQGFQEPYRMFVK